MSQHTAYDDEGREWLFGYDNPCGGYFATRFLSDEEAEKTGEDADVLIGFGIGVDLTTLIAECAKHGLDLDDSDVRCLQRDKEQEHRARTPLQAKIWEFAQEALNG